MKKYILYILAAICICNPFGMIGHAQEQQPESMHAPVLVSADVYGTEIVVTWETVDHADAYIIYRKEESADAGWERLGKVTVNSYSDTDIRDNTDYYYTVKAVIGKDKTDHDTRGIYATTKPFPEMLTAAGNPSGVEITWEAMEDAAGYYIYRKHEQSAGWKKIAEVSETSYLDINANAGKDNIYTVRAFREKDGERSLSGYEREGITCFYDDPLRLMAAEKLKESGRKLKKVYRWVKKNYPFEYDDTWNNTVVYYLEKAFRQGRTDCGGRAAIFCWMARELGYEAYVMAGEIPLQDGGFTYHSWVEITIDGVLYVCDPGITGKGWMVQYGESGVAMYSNYYYMPEY